MINSDLKKSKSVAKRYLIYVLELAVAAVLVVIDRLIKNAAVAGLKGKEDIILIKNIIGLTYAENTGAAFSFMSNSTALLSVITLILLLCGVVALFMGKIKGKLLNVCAVMILAGGAGNLWDRIAQGYVVDYIQTLFVDFPIYNFADILVTVGVFIVCVYLFYDIIRDEKKKKTEQKDGNS